MSCECSYRLFRRHPAILIVCRSVADLVFCCAIVASVVYRTVNKRNDELADGITASHCRWFSFCAEAFAIAAEIYFMMIAVDLWISISNPFTDYRVNRMWYGVTAAVVTLFCIAGVGLCLSTLPAPSLARFPRAVVHRSAHPCARPSIHPSVCPSVRLAASSLCLCACFQLSLRPALRLRGAGTTCS